MHIIIISGTFIVAFNMSMNGNSALCAVLNRMSEGQMMALPTIDPIIITVIITVTLRVCPPHDRGFRELVSCLLCA